MKSRSKVLSIIAGIVFLERALVTAINFIPLLLSGEIIYVGSLFSCLVTLVVCPYSIIVLSIMGIKALQQKSRSKLLNILGIVYIGYAFISVFIIMWYSFSIRVLLSFAILIAAFVCSRGSGDRSAADVKDTSSETAEVHTRLEEQTTIYDEQLQDGILTQEEYDQIMRRKD